MCSGSLQRQNFLSRPALNEKKSKTPPPPPPPSKGHPHHHYHHCQRNPRFLSNPHPRQLFLHAVSPPHAHAHATQREIALLSQISGQPLTPTETAREGAKIRGRRTKLLTPAIDITSLTSLSYFRTTRPPLVGAHSRQSSSRSGEYCRLID